MGLLVAAATAQAITFTNDTLVSAGNTNFDGQAIAITNCTLTVDGFHSFASVRIFNAGILTHSIGTNSLRGNSGLDLSITTNLEIEAGGAIDVGGRGYAGGAGPGAGASRSTNSPYENLAGAGGGYGGLGGSSSISGPGGASYGDLFSPADAGSGGGNGAGPGGPGGGSVKLVIGGLLRIDGKITANGADGMNSGSGGGAGGSVWVSAGTISLMGSVWAKGGQGEPYAGGGGGGGRIAIYVSGSISNSANQLSGSITAAGGSGALGGGAGTIYLRGTTDPVGRVLIDNGGSRGANTLLGLVEAADVIISGGALVQTATAPPIHNLVIQSNSWVLQAPNQILDLTVTGGAFIEKGSGMSGDGAGFSAGQGPGHGGSGPASPFSTWGGGGYGGYGGASTSNAPGGLAYGSTVEPSELGSGGGGSMGGAGGGLMRLRVQGQLDLRGTISADGSDAVGSGSGGGSGGGLSISAALLTGTGSISANGGAGASIYGGGGGGGRIQLQLGTNSFGGVISARGGPGAQYGGAGTIYTQSQAANALAAIVVDNGGHLGTNTLVAGAPPQVDLEARAGALVSLTGLQSVHNLLIRSNAWLVGSFTGQANSMTVAGNALIASGGGIRLDGQGNPGGRGLGTPQMLRNGAGGGGAYGGYGGSSSFGNPGGVAYGSASAPEQVGSGGGASIENVGLAGGGAGGGSLQLRVSGSLFLDGTISANGNPAGPAGGGGSGGGIWLTIGTFLGAGTVSANGGPGDGEFGGGGGGGRIALTFATNQFSGSVVARGGAGAVYGGAGTIYLGPTRVGLAQILVDNGGWSGADTLLSGSSFLPNSSLTLRGGASVLVSPATGTLSLRQLLIGSNAWLTLPSSTQQAGILRINLVGASIIETGGGINLDGKGNSSGPGQGSAFLSPSFGYTGGGGAHGGNGGASLANAAGGNAYDLAGTQPGSGGGSGNPQVQGAPGGGALYLTSSGSLVLDGQISANGASANTPGGGGGSGGSITLQVAALSGSGLISANGGAGDLSRGGGGGGGRINVELQPQSGSNSTAQFTGTFRAQGGTGFLNGGAGTLFLSPASAHANGLRVDNGGLAGGMTPLPSLDPGVRLELLGGAIGLAPLNPAQWSGLVVDSGAALIQSSGATNLDLLVSGDVYIGTNSLIAADGKGYSGSNGGPGAGSKTAQSGGSGGGYGGSGGAGASGLAGGSAYGSAEQPTDAGSRGGLFPIVTNSSQGGGAIRLQVTGTLTLDGKVSANGTSASEESAGGGAGGSIWISTHAVTGTGALSADGGAGDPEEGGGGGGGRIALYSGMDFFGGVLTAYGGTGANRGNNGSLILAELPALRIVAQSPTNTLFLPVDTVALTFSSPVAPNSISNSSITLQTPLGTLAPPKLRLLQVSPTQFQVSFDMLNNPGNYQIQITPGWADIFGASMSEPYLGSFTIQAPVISGHVIDTNNMPVPGVSLTTSGEFPPAQTDAKGAYSLQVLPSWIGTVTPVKNGVMFVPRTRSYNNLATNVDNQDFVIITSKAMTVSQARINGNLNLSLFGINGVTYQAFSSTNLIDWLPSQPARLGSNQIMTLTVPLGAEPVKFFRLGSFY